MFAADIGVQPPHIRVWNAAADFGLDDDLVEAGCLTLSDRIPPAVPMPDHLTANDYFLRLLEMQESQQQPRGGSGYDPGGDDSQQGRQPGSAGVRRAAD
ncbi:hypothetical protein OCAE111667_21145 [Occultella aeris]|uniref:Uncharacterized protein n=1 Tax=Occultella aeris TaxID=2761496 RepID=A0A7M4DQS3_9MICO|nr:hypothetical protein [Occultella aeris]VZO39817.1 hypothetical protein HALOF300_04514 [Occultella aeris]